MKKLFLIALLFLIGKIGYSQYPNSFGVSNSNTQYYVKGGFGADSSFVFRTAFADTTAANRGWLDGIPGCFIRTTGGFLWVRNDAATAWIYVGGGAGTGTNIYNSNGSLTGDRVLSGTNLYNLGFDAVTSFRAEANAGTGKISSMNISPDSVLFQPNEGIFIIDSLASGASTDSVLVWTQATGRVKKRSYSAFTPTWQQTLTATAGSTLTTDNTIAGGGNSILWNGFNDFEVLSSGAQLFKADFGGYSAQVGITQGLSVTIGTYDVGIPGHNSALEIYADSIGASPYSGRYAIDTLNNLSNQNTLLGRVNNISAPNGNGHGNIGYVTLGSGLSLSSGVLNTSGTVPTPISSLTAATGTNTANHGNFQQDWLWSTFTGANSGLGLSANSTVTTSDSPLFAVSVTGSNGTAGVTSTAVEINNSHSGTTPTNIGLRVEASGGTNNYALITSGGSVGIGTSTPTEILHIVGNIKGTNYIELTDVSAPSTPSSGFGRIYVRADSLRFKNDGGTEFTMGTGGGITGSGTANQVTYWNGSSSITGDAGFTRLTNEINLTQSSAGVDVAFRAKNTSTSGGYTTAAMIVENSSSFGELFKSGTGYVGYKTIAATDLGFYNTGGNISILNDYASGNINFSAGGNSTAAMTINTSNNVGIGTASPITKLNVSGYNTTNSQLAVGSLEMQPYDQSNGWLSQNIYYNSGFKYRANGAGGLFYFLGTEGQFRFAASGTAGGDPGINSIAQFKVNADGTVVIGGTASASAGTYTGATLLANSSKVGIGQNVYVGDITSTPSAYLHLKAGTASASTAPLKLTTGTSLTTAEAGAFEYTTPQLFFTNGAAVRQEIPQIQQARVSTQYDNTTTTLGTVTGLTTNVAAGKTYRFEAILYTTSNVAGGVKFAMAGTATATNIIYEAVVIDANVNAAQTRATALATTVGAVTAVTNAYAKITGTITVNAAGTFLVQAAANAATGTTSVLVGSTFVITEML